MSLITLSFKRDERDLILDTLQGLDPVIRRKLNLCEWREKRLVVDLPMKDVKLLLAALELEKGRQARPIRRRLETILEHFLHQNRPLLNDDESTFSTPPPNMDDSNFSSEPEFEYPHDFFEFVRQQMRGLDNVSTEELNRIAEASAEKYNNTPQKELGGLSPLQMHRLLYSIVGEPESVVHVNNDLSFEELESSEILVNARLFLRLLDESNGTRATDRGYLNMAFVKQFREQMFWPTRKSERIEQIGSRTTELDLFPLHILRLLSGFSGLIRKYKGKFVITKHGRNMLKENEAGFLFAELFTAFLLKFNQEYLGRTQGFFPIQYTYAYSLYKLHTHAGDWIKYDDLPEEILFQPEEAKAAIKNHPLEKYLPNMQISAQIIGPLTRFGLLEQRHKPDPKFPKWQVLDAIRTTPLFSRFLRFELDA